jgi:lauroyl/myristoyl acyltransferase
MSICDLINGAGESALAERAARCLLRRLQESEPKVVELSLTIAETCMKNCQAFMKCIEQPFMDEMIGITRGQKGKNNAAESLRLIQQWAKGLQQQKNRSSVFDETYSAMKKRGVSFPDFEENTASFDIPPPAM